MARKKLSNSSSSGGLCNSFALLPGEMAFFVITRTDGRMPESETRRIDVVVNESTTFRDLSNTRSNETKTMDEWTGNKRWQRVKVSVFEMN